MSAFVDKVRTVRFPQSSTRVEGRLVPSGTPVFGNWIRGYFDPGSEGEQPSDGGTRRRRSGASVVLRRRDTLGLPVDIDAQDVVEIVSRKHGQMTLNVVAAPTPLGGRITKYFEIQVAKTNRIESQ